MVVALRPRCCEASRSFESWGPVGRASGWRAVAMAERSKLVRGIAVAEAVRQISVQVFGGASFGFFCSFMGPYVRGV